VEYISINTGRYTLSDIAYVYLNYKQQERQSATSVLSSFTAQLLNQVPSLEGPLKALYEKCDHGKKNPEKEDLLCILSDLLISKRVMVAIDALDEASIMTRTDLLTQLLKLTKEGLLVFVTLRPDVDLRIIANNAQIMDVAARNSDLTIYAQEHLMKSAEVLDILDSNLEEIVPKIIDGILAHAAGM